MTFITLIKGFVCAGILYLPKNYYNGGYIFSPLALVLSCIFTAIWLIKLLKSRDACLANSFEDIGFKAAGRFGKNIVSFFLVVS